jgi:hypothetical protein
MEVRTMEVTDLRSDRSSNGGSSKWRIFELTGQINEVPDHRSGIELRERTHDEPFGQDCGFDLHGVPIR